jgi:Tfp pilus assembly protein PilO
MMRTRHADRLWMIGGAAVAVLLLALSWVLAISPTNADADNLREQTASTETQLTTLRRRLADLKEQEANLPTYRAALRVNQDALPEDSGVPDFLRTLQASGDSVNVVVSAVNVGTPGQNTALPTVFDLPITVTAEGSASNLGRFLDQLQRVQPRAVLIESANMTASEDDGKTSISIMLKAFVAAGEATAAPTVTTTD